MNSETLWQEISVAALLGTQRKPFQPSAHTAGELGSLLISETAAAPSAEENAPTTGGSESLLLRAAALTAQHRRAGRLPLLKTPAFPPPAPPEEWPRCSFQAGRFLEQILSTPNLALLPEWLEIACTNHQRVREEHLPALLEQQKILQSLRRVALAVLGARGRWLAAQNPAWSAFAADPDAAGKNASGTSAAAWDVGQRRERLGYLEDLRAQNPAAARDLLAATWQQESPTERLAFLQVLSTGLSMADEPFLETVLDDRRKDVRQAAVALLARLPDSRLVRRVTARARVLLNWKSGLLRSTVDVTLPDACDAGMQRDGIDPRPPAGSPLGEKAWIFAQLLGLVPPGAWSAAWNKRPQQILDTIRKHEWEAALLEGWQEAALRAQDAEWLEALVNHAFRGGDQKRLMDLFPRLPALVKERLTLALLRDYPTLSYDQNPSFFLSTCRHPWSPELTQAAAGAICHNLQRGDLQPWRWEKLLRDIAPCFHPTQLGACIERIAAALKRKPGGDPFVASLLVTLEFRLEMHHAFDQP